MSTLLPFVIVLVVFVVIFKLNQRTTPTVTERLVDGELDAIEFFWRPG